MYNPDDRLSARQALRHAYLKELRDLVIIFYDYNILYNYNTILYTTGSRPAMPSATPTSRSCAIWCREYIVHNYNVW